MSSGVSVSVGVGVGGVSSVSYEIGLVWIRGIGKVID
jgi:hypothetical protein